MYAWVGVGWGISASFVIDAPSAVPRKNDWPWLAWDGAELIVGRAPLNRYGGEKISGAVLGNAEPSGCPPPPRATRPSGKQVADEW